LIDLKYQLVYNAVLRGILQGEGSSIESLVEETGLGRGLVEEALRYIGVAPQELGTVDASRIVINAWKSGFDVVGLALELGWRGLEELCSAVFVEAGYSTLRNFRFRSGGRRYEVDVVAWRGGYIIAADCKRWSRLRRSALREAALRQRERARALAEGLQEVALPLRGGVYHVCPAVIAVYGPGREIYGGVPIVSLRELRGFLSSFEGSVADMRCFRGVKRSLF